MRRMDSKDVELPEGKRRELAFVVDVIREGFADAVQLRRKPETRDGKILKIILFGSHGAP